MGPTTHLLLQLLDGPEVGLVAGAHQWLLLLAALLDAALQLRILPLQLPHLLQVAGQAVIQELHGLLLTAIEGALAEPATVAHIGGDVAGPRQGDVVAAGSHAGPGGAAGEAAQVGQAAVVRHGAGREPRSTGRDRSLIPFLRCEPGPLQGPYILSAEGGAATYSIAPFYPVYQFFHLFFGHFTQVLTS